MSISYYFEIVFFIGFICLIVGLIKPALVIRWREPHRANRKTVGLIYGIGTFIFMLLMAFTAPDPTPQQVAEAAQKVEAKAAIAAKEAADKEAKQKEKEDAKRRKAAEEEALKAEDAKKADEEKKKKAADEAGALKAAEEEKQKQEAANHTYKIIDYNKRDGMLAAVTAPTHEAVQYATEKILSDKKLNIELLTPDGAPFLIDFYTDEKAAKLALITNRDLTDDEEQYWEDHRYAKYSYSVDIEKAPPGIKFLDYDKDHMPHVIDQIILNP